MERISGSIELLFYVIVAGLILTFLRGMSVVVIKEGIVGKNKYFWGIGTMVGILLWLAITGIAAKSGILQDFTSLPPKFIVIFLILTSLTTLLAFSQIGSLFIEHVGIIPLIGHQVFRIPVEVFLYQMHSIGAVPAQMTISGWNFDIITGITAPLLAWYFYRKGTSTGLTLVWNVLGLAFLINVVVTAILSAPTPFQVFPLRGVETFVPAYFPYIWLPTVIVQAAFFGHLLIFRWIIGIKN